MLGAADKTEPERGRILRARALILAVRVDRALNAGWSGQAARFGTTQLWAQTWSAFSFQQATAFVDGSFTALSISELEEVVEAAEAELPDAARIEWFYWNHDGPAWSSALAATPRRLQVAKSDGGRANFGVSDNAGAPAFTVAAWTSLATVHYPSAMKAATAEYAPIS